MPRNITTTLLAQDRPPVTEVAEGRPRAAIGEVVIINDFSTAQGGATVIALLEAREYRRLGYKVTYICGDSPSEELAKLGVVQISLQSTALLAKPTWRAISEGFHNGAAAKLIAQWIARHDTSRTVYHLHNWSQILSPSVFEALRPVEDRLVVTCHDFFNICPNGGFMHFNEVRTCEEKPLSIGCLANQCDRRSAPHKYWRSLRHMQLNRTARFRDSRATFTFLHQGMEAKFVQGGFAASDLVTIPNPVEPWTRDRIQAERNEGFLFVGRIGRDKGANLAIAAARAVGQKLTLIGTGEINPEEHADDPNIQFTGWKSRAQIAEIARKARAVIVPTRIIEPFGLVVLEAAMSGLPVIISSHALLAADVADLGFGKAFRIDENDGLAELMIRFADDDPAIERMSRAGFAHARSLCHSPGSWIDELTRLFTRKLDRCAEPIKLEPTSA